MPDELLNRADVELDPDVALLYGDRDAQTQEKVRVQQLVAATLRDAVASVVELGIPEYLTVEKTIAQGEAGSLTEVSDISADFPDVLLDGSWRLEGIVAITDANATADLTVTIAGLLPGVSLAIKAARTIVVGGQGSFTPIYQTIRQGQRAGDFGGVLATVSGGAANDKMYLAFVFRKVRDVRVQGL